MNGVGLAQVEEVSRKLSIRERVAQYITIDSPVFSFHVETQPLEDFLRIEDFNGSEEPPVHFSEALRAMRDTSGLTTPEMTSNACSKDTSLLAHIINRSGSRWVRGSNGERAHQLLLYRDTAYAPITAGHLINLAREVKQEKGFIGPALPTERIALTFFDSVTGDLILRNYDEMESGFNSWENVWERTKEYLAPTDRSSAGVSATMRYITNLARSRYDFLKGDGNNLSDRDGVVRDGILQKDLVIKRNSKMAVTLPKFARALGMVPVYLVFPPNRLDVLDGEKVVKTHIDRTYNKD